MRRAILVAMLATSWCLFALGSLGAVGNTADTQAVSAVAQTTPQSLPFNWENLSALGILGLAVGWIVAKVIPGYGDRIKEIVADCNATNRQVSSEFSATVKAAFDRLESIDNRRHADSERTTETIRGLAETCARAHAKGA